MAIRLKMKYDNKHYNPNKCYSYNMFMNLITGGRGIGKTCAWTIAGCNNYITKGEEFIYLRRYKTETQKSKKLLNKIIGKTKTRGIGNNCFEWLDDDKIIGYSIALSVSTTFKSTNFDKVTLIIFDEAILMRGGSYKYLKNEVEVLLEFISSVFRTRQNCKVVILGNNLDIFNIYYEYFNVPSFENIYINKERGICCEMCKDSYELRKDEEKTPLFKLIQNTEYGDYHYNNKVLTNPVQHIAPKQTVSRLICRLVINKITLNIYLQAKYDIYIELRDSIINDSITYVILENNKPNYFYIREFRKSGVGSAIYKAYYDNKVYYENEKAFSIFENFIETL